MTYSFLEDALRDTGAIDFLQRTSDGVLSRSIAAGLTDDTAQPDPERLPRFAFMYEAGGLAVYKTLENGQSSSDDRGTVRESFSKAMVCWQALLSLPEADTHDYAISGQSVSQTGLRLLAQELPDEVVPPDLTLAFRVAVSGLLAERPAEVRLELRRFSFGNVDPNASWRSQVVSHILRGFALLCRKDRGWADIGDALASIGQLRALQQEHEDTYIDGHEDPADQTAVAYELVGLYHLAQMLTTTGDYLKNGQPSLAQVRITLDRHRDRASTSFHASRSPILAHIAELLWIGCRELARNSIWSHVASLGERVRGYAKLLTEEGQLNPIIELWPSQQEALSRNLMDPYGRAILIEMPTGAGKTLLAKFLIVQTKALNPNGTVAYVVPTRALVNQVTVDLRGDFRSLDLPIIVEQAVPAFELDPTEKQLLGDTPPDVLVTTPEKLDLLLRKEHPAVSNIAMVVADEAHNIGSPDRGPRLELLLGMLRRDQENVRFVLLSPFLPNDEELVTWLGGDRALPPIVVNWRPGKKVVGAIRLRGRGPTRAVVLETIPAVDNTDISPGLMIPLTTGGVTDISQSLRGLTQASVQSFLERGAILVLCRGRGTTVSRAEQISSELPSVAADDFLEAVIRYIETEAGTRISLVECLQHGVAYHHSGLSQESRWLIETLIKQDKVKRSVVQRHWRKE